MKVNIKLTNQHCLCHGADLQSAQHVGQNLGYHGSAELARVHDGAVAGVQDGSDLGVGLLVTTHPDCHLTCTNYY